MERYFRFKLSNALTAGIINTNIFIYNFKAIVDGIDGNLIILGYFNYF